MTLIGSLLTGMESGPTGEEFRPPKTEMEKYIEQLGRLIASLHSLELWLRAFLFGAEGHPNPGVDLYKVMVGDTVPENSMTDYASLGGLIERFNGLVAAKATIPKDALVTLRDSLAHGRVYSNKWQPPFRLVTFHRPKNGIVEVKGVEELDAAWLEAKALVVADAFGKVFGSVAISVLAPSKK